MTESTIQSVSKGIRVLSGRNDILVVAPHSPLIKGEFQNDARTGIIAETLHRQMGCSTIINDLYFKPKGPVKKDAEQFLLDLYRVDHSKKAVGYIEAMKSVVNSSSRLIVLWLHGIFDHFARDRGKEHIEQELFDKDPEALHALIAYGQGGDPKSGNPESRFSASQTTVDTFLTSLNKNGMNTILTHPDCNNYRGRDNKRFNQFFLNQGFSHNQVESIQLEIRESGFRDSRKNAIKTAKIIQTALDHVLNP